MPGHVFLTQGDLTQLNCDAWLLPTDVSLGVTPSWPPELRDRADRLRQSEGWQPTGWGNHGVRVIPFADWPEHPRIPRPYLVNVGGVPGTDPEWYLEGAHQFFRVVGQHQSGESVTGRPKPLVALPLIGIGYGAAGAIKGAIVRALVAALYEAAAVHDIDIVLVTNNPPAFLAAQNARRQYLGDHHGGRVPGPWPDLEPRLAADAERLAGYAARGSLVLFLGAGIGNGAGLPTWDELLAALAEVAGMDQRERAALTKLHNLDRARILEARLAMRGVALGKAISDRLTSDHYSLAHSMLAALPVSEVVTTNYDCLFEVASAAAGHEPAVLPYQSVVGHSRWLLKLHGSVTHPGDIVLTREDYLRYADRRAALAGIVQALLITRHMLFVGFSLIDENFHRIVDDVRKAIGGMDGRRDAGAPFGTALLLRKDDLLEELWRADLNLVSMSEQEQAATPDAARQLEIFLDYLLAETTRGTSPLLDPAYDGVLTSEEREIRALLQALQSGATDAVRHSPTWRPIAELLTQFGEPPALR